MDPRHQGQCSSPSSPVARRWRCTQTARGSPRSRCARRSKTADRRRVVQCSEEGSWPCRKAISRPNCRHAVRVRAPVGCGGEFVGALVRLGVAMRGVVRPHSAPDDSIRTRARCPRRLSRSVFSRNARRGADAPSSPSATRGRPGARAAASPRDPAAGDLAGGRGEPRGARVADAGARGVVGS